MGGARQLNLFAGKRQRGKQTPPALEFATHCMVADLLRLSLTRGWIFFHVGNGERRDAITGARLKRLGVLPGVSDFLLIGPPAGQVRALELKRRGEKPTLAQTAFLEAVRLAGGDAEWVDSYEAAVAVLRRWGAVRLRCEAIVALSGGKDSTAMALRLAEIEPRQYQFVCTPTGDELPEMVDHWLHLGGLLGSPLLPVTERSQPAGRDRPPADASQPHRALVHPHAQARAILSVALRSSAGGFLCRAAGRRREPAGDDLSSTAAGSRCGFRCEIGAGARRTSGTTSTSVAL